MLYIFLIIYIITTISLFMIFKKANKKTWKAIIPIYNIIVLLQICDLPLLYLLFLIIPIFNIYIIFKISLALSTSFDKSVKFGIICCFLPFIGYPILAFSNCKYKKIGYESELSIEQSNQYNETIDNAWKTVPLERDITLNKTIEQPIDVVVEEPQKVDNNVQPIQENLIKEDNSIIEYKKCKKCGAKIDGSAKGCFMCGAKF